MPRITLAIRTPFGEIRVSGENPSEVMDSLAGLDQKFIGEVNERITTLLATQANQPTGDIVHEAIGVDNVYVAGDADRLARKHRIEVPLTERGVEC